MFHSAQRSHDKVVGKTNRDLDANDIGEASDGLTTSLEANTIKLSLAGRRDMSKNVKHSRVFNGTLHSYYAEDNADDGAFDIACTNK